MPATDIDLPELVRPFAWRLGTWRGEGVGGYPTDRYVRYHEEKAKGGAGLVQAFGTASVHPSSPGGPGNLQLFDDSIVPYFSRMPAEIHHWGALVTCLAPNRMVQIEIQGTLK